MPTSKIRSQSTPKRGGKGGSSSVRITEPKQEPDTPEPPKRTRAGRPSKKKKDEEFIEESEHLEEQGNEEEASVEEEETEEDLEQAEEKPTAKRKGAAKQQPSK